MATISKKTFTEICNAFSENSAVYHEIDELIECSQRRREYYKKAIEPIMHILVNDIVGKETLSKVTYQDDWGSQCLYDMAMYVIYEYFNNDTQTIAVKSKTAKNGTCYVGFKEVFTPGVIYDWLHNLDTENKDTWTLPVGHVSSGYDIVRHDIVPLAF